MKIKLLPRDKANHYFYGTIAGAAAAIIFTILSAICVFFFDWCRPCELWPVVLVAPVLAAAIVGAHKEWKDSQDSNNDGKPDGTVDKWDLFYTLAGGIPVSVGVAVGLLFSQ